MSRWIAAAVLGWLVLVGVFTPSPVYSHKPITTNILFKNEIAQIFQRKCFQCHSDNNLSMSLTTYTDARPWARAIREEVLDREMPPWQAVPGYGQFANDLSLNSREKEIILSWADGGAPSGVLKAEESIPPVYVPAAPAWDHGEPDLVVALGPGQAVAAGAPFHIHRVVIDTKLPAAARLHAIALKQGERRVVRHATFYDATTGKWIGGWTPWQTFSQLPGDTAIALPANARIAVEIGYSGSDEDVTDRSEVGFYFEEGRGPGGRVADAFALTAPESRVGAGATAHRVRVETTLADATTLLALSPSPGSGARAIELMAVTPDGMSKPLLWVNDFRPEWRSSYVLASALDMPRGTRLLMTTYFDNPGDQPAVVKPEMWIATVAASRPASARQR